MRLFSAAGRVAIVALTAVACGELYARVGSVDRGATAMFNLSDANTEMSRLGALPMGPTSAGSPEWFGSDPVLPLLANGPDATTFPELDARAADPAILAITGLNFPRVYNRALVTRSLCENLDQSFYRKLPHDLFVFEPRADEVEPGYRFFPNARYPSGMRTNHLGYRSPEITPTRQPDVVRVAFVGSSTVAGHPRATLSSPDYVMYWLSMWARARHLGVRFDYVTAAREGIGIRQVTEILTREVAALKPDIVIFWGFESFDFTGFVHLPDGVVLGHAPTQDMLDGTHLSAGLRAIVERSALVRLANAWRTNPFDRNGLAREPVKPAYERRFPIDFKSPSASLGQDVPTSLARAYYDLDRFITAVQGIGAMPILTTDQYAGYDGAVIAADRSTLDPLKAATIHGVYGYLNEGGFWPLTYADQRGILEYQTHLFQGLARRRHVAFVDLLTARHLDTALFLDGIHLTPLGMKLFAWWMFQSIAPTVESYLHSRPSRDLQVAPADLTYLLQPPQRIDATRVDCSPTQPADDVPGAYSVNDIVSAYTKASVAPAAVPTVTTSVEPSSYAARVPLHAGVAGQLHGKGWVAVRLRVTEGRINVGILDQTAQRFLVSRSISASAGVEVIYLPLDDLAHIGDVMISNGLTEPGRSVAQIHAIVLKQFR